MNAYLLVFDDSQIVREVITKKLDKMPEIQNWMAFLSNTVSIISSEDAHSVSDLVRDAFPELRFIVVEIDREKKGGYLPKSVWKFINRPSPAESSAA